jgi:flagellar basal-body rod protein FlgB
MDGMSLLNAMAQRMRWQQQRQDLLAQNVANADTPNYRGQELKPTEFGDEVHAVSSPRVVLAATSPMHIAGPASDGGGDPEVQANFEVTPEGNGVTLEDEMMKVTANQMDYEAVTTLYTKSLGLIRTALGQP